MWRSHVSVVEEDGLADSFFRFFRPTEFVLRDCIESEIKDAVEQMNLKLLDGDAGDPILDFKELLTKFEVSKDFSFSCEIALQSSFTKRDIEDSHSPDGAIEVEGSGVTARQDLSN